MIYPILHSIKFHSIKHPMVNMSSVGDITIFDNKSTILYPYVNIDVLSSTIVNYSKKYTIRLYVCDRQKDPLISYNKTELIADNIIKDLEMKNYSVNYFHNDFQDDVDGVFADFQYEVPVVGECDYSTLFNNFLLLEDGSFIMLENGDLISLT